MVDHHVQARRQQRIDDGLELSRNLVNLHLPPHLAEPAQQAGPGRRSEVGRG